MNDEEIREDENALVPADFQFTEVAEPVNDDEESLDADYSGVQLPTYNEVNDRKVLGAVKQYFRDFHYEPGDDLAAQYPTPERLAEYIDSGLDSMERVQETMDRDKVAMNAAICGRFWFMAHVIKTVLADAAYGEHGLKKVEALIKHKKWGQSMIYSVKKVADNLTSTDCWLLGARGATKDHLRKLANIKDDGTRKAIMQAFIETVSDTGNKDDAEKALKQFKSAINAARLAPKQFAQLETSDPVQVMPEEDLFPGYTKGIDAMKTISKMVKDLLDNDKMVDVREAIEDMWVSASMPDAETRVDEAKEMAEARIEQLKDAAREISTLIASLETIQGLAVSEAE